MFCLECGKEMSNDSMFCPECGAKQNMTNISDSDIAQIGEIDKEIKFCYNCGGEMSIDNQICSECGAKQNMANISDSDIAQVGETDKEIKFCNNCGCEMSIDNQICSKCGTKQNMANISDSDIVQVGETDKEIKFCYNCGCEMSIDNQFCPDCQIGQGFQDITLASKVNKQTPPQTTSKEQPNIKNTKKNKIIITIILGVIAGILILCAIIATSSSFSTATIDLNNYISVSFEGYESVGTAIAVFDIEKFREDYEEGLLKKIENYSDWELVRFSNLYYDDYYSDYDYNYDESDFSKDFFLNIAYSFDVEDGLSNGDIVNLMLSFNNYEELKQYGYKIKYTEKEYIVSGLEELETFDPFEGMEVYFEGFDSEAYIDIFMNSPYEEMKNLDYEVDVSSGLSNGDVVTISISTYYHSDPVKYCAMNYGKIPYPLEKEVVVEGLYRYISSLDDITKTDLERMKSQAVDVYVSQAAQHWGNEETLTDLSYLGTYLLTSKKVHDVVENPNMLYLVYKATVNATYSNDYEESYNGSTDIYWYIEYRSLLVNEYGQIDINVLEYKTPQYRFTVDSGVRSGWVGNKSWQYYGYKTLDELYKMVVTANADLYKSQKDINEDLAEEIDIEGTQDLVLEYETEFIFPDSSTRILSEAEIKKLSDNDLRFAVNELYARHGYIFKSEDLSSYFKQFDWYEEKVKPEDFSMDLFNEVERKNVELLQKIRDSRN